MKKNCLLIFLFTSILMLSCSRAPTMPENKILKEEYNLEKNIQDVSVFMKSITKDTLDALVTGFADKYKEKNLFAFRLKVYNSELPVELIDKINAPMTVDSLNNAVITFPPKGVKYAECWYWYKRGERDIGDIKERK